MADSAGVQLFQGDCLEIMPTLAAAAADLVLCDLPYGTTQNKWDSALDLDRLWSAYGRIAKLAAPVVLTAAQPFTALLVVSNTKHFKYQWVWEKHHGTGFLNAKKQPLRIHEDVLVFYAAQPVYNPQKTPGKPYTVKRRAGGSANYGSEVGAVTENTGDRCPTTIIKISTDKQRNPLHPTQKPVALMEYLIKTYTNAGDTVLDNCMGSGTTGVACVNTGRSFIGIEKDPGYFDIATRRIKEAQERAALTC